MHRSGFDTSLLLSVPTVVLLSLFATAGDQEPVTIYFDNSGPEQGVTPPGTRDFTFMGSSWSGGMVATEGILGLYASGSYHYQVMDGGVDVVFDPPVDSVEFFFVHGFDFPQGVATAFDAAGEMIGTVESREATEFGDPENFVSLDPDAEIARIEFSGGGVIDNFTIGPPTGTEPPSSPPIEEGETTIVLEEVASGLVAPNLLTHAGDGSGRLFVVDQIGVIRVIEDGVLLETPFIDLRSKIVEVDPGFDERGLLGMTFHPEFAANGRFFLRYSVPREGADGDPCLESDRGCHTEVLAEYTVLPGDPTMADPESERVLLEIDEPEFNHNAGQVLFGPDGFLYLSLGDGGGRDDGLSSTPPAHGPMGNAQNVETLLGSLLRIDVDAEEQPYGIPADNPFVDGDGLDEIFAYGFRNPFRFSFDRETGELFLADVGQDLFEEINSVEMGGNYGWVIREGAHCFDPMSPEEPPEDCPTEGLTDPIAEYDHSEGLAVIGGYVYRGEQSPELVGKYIFGDYNLPEIESGRLFYLETEGDRSRIFEFRLGEENEPLGASVLGFGEDADGEVYVLTSTESGPTGTTGAVYRIATSGAAPEARQVPGDCNQDGIVDIADAICLFIHLLGGDEGELGLPCADAGIEAPGNLELLDWQGDDAVDVSDGVAAVNYLFAGGSPHMLMESADPSGCVPIAGCQAGPGCP